MPYQEISKTALEGVYIILPKIFGDERGWYIPQLEISEMEQATGARLKITQEAESFNTQIGQLRGLHYQKPNTQGKLVRVISGKVLDVVVDLRQDSPSFGQHLTVELSSENYRQLWVPPGLAHGYLTLEENTRFSYLVTDGVYDKPSEKGLNPFDPQLNINWLLPKESISINPRDLSWPNLKDINKEDLL